MTKAHEASGSGAVTVHDYVNGYHLDLTDEGGGVYSPTEHEKAMIEDAIEGYLAEAALSSLEQPSPGAVTDAMVRDAARWNALLRCARIRMFGSAGFDPKTGERQEYRNATETYEKSSEGWVHFGAEFWSVYPGAENYDGTNQWGIHALTALADDVLLKEGAALSATEQPAAVGAPFGYWVEHRLSDGLLIRKPAYIPEASDTVTVTPLYTGNPAPSSKADEHSDDKAVDRFAAAMKAKLAKKRAEGRGGWEGQTCNASILSTLLREHVDKGDPLDVGNFAMMLHQRGDRIVIEEETATPASAEAELRAEVERLTKERDGWEARYRMEEFPNIIKLEAAEARAESLKASLYRYKAKASAAIKLVEQLRELKTKWRNLCLQHEQTILDERARAEALKARLGTARADAFEEAAQIADEHARNAWEIAVCKGEDDICASGRHYGARDIAIAIRRQIREDSANG